MERDFLGLSLKNDLEEALDGSKNQASLRGSSIQWPFSNKVAAIPDFLSFKFAEDEGVRKAVVDPLTSNGFMAWPASNSFYSFQRPVFGAFQENGIIDCKAGNQGAIDRPNINSQSISNIRQQPQGVSFAGPLTGHPLPSSQLKTNLRNPSKSCVSPQLTIFYDGSVSVYDDVSPESAKAIMLLAGNGSTKSEKNTSFSPQMKVQSQCQTPSGPDLLHHIKPSGTLGSHNPSLDSIKPSSTIGSSPTHASSAIAQARKASLARFLVKREERKLNACPYNLRESECSSDIVDRSGTGPLPAPVKQEHSPNLSCIV